MRIALVILASVILLSGVASAATGPENYLVGYGDVLKISVYDQPDLNTVVRISADGSIQFPLIGTVELEGLNVAQITQRLESRLADGYLINPHVSVFIQEYRSKKVVIMGRVKDPGVYELRGPTDLLELISMAGGLREDAGDKLTINRQESGAGHQPQVIHVDLRQLLQNGDASQNEPIRDRDNIFVSKAGMLYVTGEVKKPDAYKYEEGTTVLKVISMAGGFSKIASKGRIRIIRTVNGKEQIFEDVALKEPLKPDDVVVVPESFF